MFRSFSSNNYKTSTKILSHVRNYRHNDRKWLHRSTIIPFAVLSIVLYEYDQLNSNKAYMNANESVKNSELFYRQVEISKHKTKADRVWVTYGDGVYDITGTASVAGFASNCAFIMDCLYI